MAQWKKNQHRLKVEMRNLCKQSNLLIWLLISWNQRCISWTQNTRERSTKRGKNTRRNRRIWAIYGITRAIQDTRWLYLWKWDRASQSWNRDISPTRKIPSWYLMRRANKGCACKDTSLSTRFSPSRWAYEFYRSLECRMARTLPHTYMEVMISHCITW